jgi:LysM repeat protein
VGADLSYTVQPGDTLGGIATEFGTTVQTLVAANGLANADALFAGQILRVSTRATADGPALAILPDSELVRGPAYVGFDIRSAVEPSSGLLTYSEVVDGVPMSGLQIVERISSDFSVGPRVLLAQLEAVGGVVTGPGSAPLDEFPVGLVDPSRAGLWRQLNWFADRLNKGFYDWRGRDSRLMVSQDGVPLAGHESLGPGSFAVHAALVQMAPADQLEHRLGLFADAYGRLFGDPWAKEFPAPAAPPGEFPPLELPWSAEESWWFTGGPHGGWAQGSAWSALDFVPPDGAGCVVSSAWARAVADGMVVDAGLGAVALDLDADGAVETGPVVYYLHLAADERAAAGTRVRAGDRMGHPSCEGGRSDATHLHIARRLDGEWLSADGPPFVLGDWTFTSVGQPYDGAARNGAGDSREPCQCRELGVNDISD